MNKNQNIPLSGYFLHERQYRSCPEKIFPFLTKIILRNETTATHSSLLFRNNTALSRRTINLGKRGLHSRHCEEFGMELIQ